METTLVTGATGLVGYNILMALRQRQRKVRVLVRSLEKARRRLPADCELVQGDVTDRDSVDRAMAGCRVVYHAAGFPEQWMKNSDIFDQVNVGGTCNMIDAALRQNIRRFVYTSTIDVFAAAPLRAVWAGPQRFSRHQRLYYKAQTRPGPDAAAGRLPHGVCPGCRGGACPGRTQK